MSDNKVPMKFRVRDEQHSKEIQEKLFSLGVKWNNGAEVQYADRDYLYAEKCLSWSNDEGKWDTYFEDNLNEEYVLLDGEFVPADSVAAKILSMKTASNYPDTVIPGDVSSKPVKSDGGSSQYYALTITNKDGESINVETGDILRALVGNDFDLSNIVKACRRAYEASQGRGKEGASIAYDMRKIEYFAKEYAHWNKDK